MKYIRLCYSRCVLAVRFRTCLTQLNLKPKSIHKQYALQIKIELQKNIRKKFTQITINTYFINFRNYKVSIQKKKNR